MWQIGVWEQNEGLAERLSRLGEGRALIRACSHPALLAGTALDLLVVPYDGGIPAELLLAQVGAALLLGARQ